MAAAQVYVPIYRQQGASSLAVANGVKAKLQYIKDRCPKGTKLTFVMDQSIYVKEAIQSLIHEGVIGAVLVSIMILIFLGNWRMTLIASMSIPLAILGAIIGLYVTGNTINAMTLGGLALAIGPLVDDAIVELENNHRNYNLGKSRIRAALDGCAEVMVPVLVATCTTNIVLAPLALMPGMGGFLFRPLALAVTFAMFSSFLLSRTFVPMMCAKFLPDEHRSHATAGTGSEQHAHGKPTSFFGRLHHRFEQFLDTANRSYVVQLERAIRHRWKVLGFVGFLILLAVGLSFFIGREFFPQVDAGQITMYFRCPSNLRLDAAEKRVASGGRLHPRATSRTDELEMIVSEMGVDPDWSAAYTDNSGPAGHRHPHPADREAQAQRPGVRHQAPPCHRAGPRISPICASASTPAAWSRPPSTTARRRRSTFRSRAASARNRPRLPSEVRNEGARHPRASPTPACSSASTPRT